MYSGLTPHKGLRRFSRSFLDLFAEVDQSSFFLNYTLSLISLHFFLSFVFSFQLSTPTLLRSLVTSCIHLALGLPLLFLPPAPTLSLSMSLHSPPLSICGPTT